MDFRTAGMKDFERLTSFYRYVIDHTANMGTYTRWIYGKHPNDTMIRGYIEQGAMYYLEDNDKIAAAVAVIDSQGEDYHNINWGIQLKDDEVAVIHILCVNPDYQKQGLGKRMVRDCIDISINNGKKAVRLDALGSNTPAQRMYESLGFTYRGKQNLYAGNTGWTDFFFYEYIL